MRGQIPARRHKGPFKQRLGKWGKRLRGQALAPFKAEMERVRKAPDLAAYETSLTASLETAFEIDSLQEQLDHMDVESREARKLRAYIQTLEHRMNQRLAFVEKGSRPRALVSYILGALNLRSATLRESAGFSGLLRRLGASREAVRKLNALKKKK